MVFSRRDTTMQLTELKDKTHRLGWCESCVVDLLSFCVPEPFFRSWRGACEDFSTRYQGPLRCGNYVLSWWWLVGWISGYVIDDINILLNNGQITFLLLAKSNQYNIRLYIYIYIYIRNHTPDTDVYTHTHTHTHIYIYIHIYIYPTRRN